MGTGVSPGQLLRTHHEQIGELIACGPLRPRRDVQMSTALGVLEHLLLEVRLASWLAEVGARVPDIARAQAPVRGALFGLLLFGPDPENPAFDTKLWELAAAFQMLTLTDGQLEGLVDGLSGVFEPDELEQLFDVIAAGADLP